MSLRPSVAIVNSSGLFLIQTVALHVEIINADKTCYARKYHSYILIGTHTSANLPRSRISLFGTMLSNGIKYGHDIHYR